jgi:hypothetical protein
MICCICGEEVIEPCSDPAFMTDEINAHERCWYDYKVWMEEYTKRLHAKQASESK